VGADLFEAKRLMRSSSGFGWPRRTTNARGFAHGGLIAALTDRPWAQFAPTRWAAPISLVTVNMSIDFISSAQIGQWLTVENRCDQDRQHALFRGNALSKPTMS